MLNNATCFDKIILITGYSDLRKGIDGLAGLIKYKYNLDPFEKEVLYLFCGRNSRKLKGLVWEGDGFLLLAKRLEANGHFQWPRKAEEAMNLSQEQFDWLMKGLAVVPGIHPITRKLIF